MAYSAEVMKRARDRLAQAKTDRESENRQHLREAYEKLPRLREIDRQLRLSMAVAAQTMFSQGEDMAVAFERVKQENLALQKERETLIATNFSQGYLDETPICSRCGGSGYIGANLCSCLAELCRQEQKQELAFLGGGKSSFAAFSLEYYPQKTDARYGASPREIMERNFNTCYRYATTFAANAGNLLFVGGTGLGKTFLSACIADAVADRGYSVVYESSSKLFSTLEQAKFTGDEEARQAAQKYSQCDLLILDDLGTELPGQFVTAALYNLLNERLLAGKAMVISTNLNIDEAAKRYSPQIASRLQGSFTLLPFVGEDIRVKINRRG